MTSVEPGSVQEPRWWRRTVSAICLFSLVTCIFLVWQHLRYKEEIYAAKKSELTQLTIGATQQIGTILQQAMQSAESLAEGLSNGTVSKDEMLSRLKEMVASNPNYYGGTIAFAPYAHDSTIRLYSPYYSKSGPQGELEFQDIAAIYDYTAADHDWYVDAVAKGNRWGQPYWDAAGRTNMTTYSALFYRVDPATRRKVPVGVVTVDLSMQWIRDVIESLDIGPSGFGALTTQAGNYLYHPSSEYVQTLTNIRDVARQKGDTDRLAMAEMAARGEGGIINHISTTTGQESWLVFETVPVSGWSLQNTFITSDLDINVNTLRRQIIWTLISVIVFIGSAAFLVLRADWDAPVRVWLASGIVSALFVIGIGAMWYLALTYHSSARIPGVKVADKATLRTQINHYQNTSEKKHLPRPVVIPTGLYIDAVELKGANDVLVTGRIWQKYPAGYPRELAKGIQFGHARDVKFEKTGVHAVADGELMQWTFEADLRVEFDHSRYPLEVEKLVLPLMPSDPDGNLMLVPDLDAYTLTTPTLLPGLDRAVFIPGWRLTETFFLLRTAERNTNFGLTRNIGCEQLPTLYYVVGVQRIFIHAFISNLTPLIVVSIILFALALLSKTVEIGRMLSVSVAVFFVVVFSHLDIRKSIAAGEIFYLEYIYFVIYAMIILVPMDAFRLAVGLQTKFYDCHNGLLANVLFWPFVLGIFFAITVIKFY